MTNKQTNKKERKAREAPDIHTRQLKKAKGHNEGEEVERSYKGKKRLHNSKHNRQLITRVKLQKSTWSHWKQND